MQGRRSGQSGARSRGRAVTAAAPAGAHIAARAGAHVAALAAALALLALTPPAARAGLVAVARTTLSAGPTLAGSAVVWAAPAGGPGFTVREAVPGSAPATIYAAPPVPADEEIDPLGLDGSPTRVAFAYAIETRPTGDEDTPSPLFADAFGGAPAGPFGSLGQLSVPTDQSLRPVAIGLTGDDVVLAEPADQFGTSEHAHVQDLADGSAPTDIGPVGTDSLDVAGSYIASSNFARTATIAVTDLAGAPVFKVAIPESNGPGLIGGCQSQTETQIGFAACGFAIGADGTLAVAVETRLANAAGSATYRLYWASPSQPQLHALAVTPTSSILAVADDEIVYVAAAGARAQRLALTGLSAATRPISFQFPADALSGLAFDGTNLAWSTADCLYAGPLPLTMPAGPPPGTCPQDEFSLATPLLAHDRLVPITITCLMAGPTGCRGTITLRSPLHAAHGRTRSRTLAALHFALVLNATRTVRVRVKATRLSGVPVTTSPSFDGKRGPRAVAVDATVSATDASALTDVQTAQLDLAL
jgi:hypothetical protein